ncbi:MAG: class I SAM-dependent methyltransferase [Solirubrobacteraceae bacterium]
MQRPLTATQIRDVNIRYHNLAAAGYDAKWGIDFGSTSRSQVLRKVARLVNPLPASGFGRALEIGAGTGYFGLNLLAHGAVSELTCSDISPRMVAVLSHNATAHDLHVSAVCADAAALPFDDGSFDVILGHAVLHHLPELPRSFAEFWRVLAPGGRIIFAGEPSRIGDRLAQAPKRAAALVAPFWRRVLGARAAAVDSRLDNDLEWSVDAHTFAPGELRRLALGAGFSDVRVAGEELLANWFGWFNRSLERTADPQDVPSWWRQYAFHGYLWLQQFDGRLLEPRAPAALFYNLLLTAVKPAPDQRARSVS